MPLRLTLLLLLGACGVGGDRRGDVASLNSLADSSAAPAAIAISAPAAQATASAWQVTLVDSVAYHNDMADGVLHHVRVAMPEGVDTLDGVLTNTLPVIVGDSAIVGLRWEQDQVVGLFAYDRRSRRTRRIVPPAGWLAYSAPAIAPDGSHVAYMGVDDRGRAFAAVATVPDGRVIYRGAPATMLETDAGVDHVAWLDAAQFEIRIALTYNIGGEQRTRGTLTPLMVRLDTVRAEATPRSRTR